MATSPRSAPGSPSPVAPPGGRLHIHGIKEMPAGYDAEVADLFRDLRAASGMSETDLAAQLATRLEVVQALEQGAIYALPPWPETCRVVSTYGHLLNLDVRPLLRRIYSQIEAGIVELAPKPMPDVPVMMPPQDGMHDAYARQAPAGQRQAEPFPAAPRQPAPQQRPQAPVPNRQPPQHAGQPPAQHFRPQPQGYPQGAPPRAAPPPQQPQQRPQAAQELRVQPRPQGEVRALPQPQARPQAAPAQQKAAKPQAAAKAKPESKGKRRLLKWGIATLLASALAFGLWVWLAQPSLLGFGPAANQSEGGAPAPSDDPNDPRSRKADRLPSPPS